MMIFFLIFAVVLALLFQRIVLERSLDDVTADHRPDRGVVEPGEVFSIQVTLQNKGRRFVPFLRVRECFEKSFQPLEGAYRVALDHLGLQYVEFTTWLRPRQQLTRSIPVTIGSRGRYVLKDMTLFGGDFLGLNEEYRNFGRFNEVVVAPYPAASVKLNDMFGGFMGEVSVSRFILEDPVLTLGYREYTGREPIKMISWTQSARGSGLMVKKNDYTLEPSVSVLLNVDTATEDSEALLEQCFSLARSVCDLLEKRGVKYTFSTNSILAGKIIDPGAAAEGLGRRHFMGILEQLGRATGSAAISLEQLLEKESLRQTSAGRILITPDSETASPRTMSRLREAAGGHLLILRASEVMEC